MFTVTRVTTLPVAMVYAGKPEVSAQVSGIAPSEGGAKAFVERLVMQTVSLQDRIHELLSRSPKSSKVTLFY
ncbi:hypothetical protein KIN20_025101 [Parelaphostrongylus tenuis]|uniref:Uncharacterized protein n=1 Tax=Parelaphostrongylus tenuis TaxID=148309 RepID=A0AAD5MUK9_PARTN|nr:hypothetical protein KIN20_025101 [Parelaphostrongylus tenuis]